MRYLITFYKLETTSDIHRVYGQMYLINEILHIFPIYSGTYTNTRGG